MTRSSSPAESLPSEQETGVRNPEILGVGLLNTIPVDGWSDLTNPTTQSGCSGLKLAAQTKPLDPRGAQSSVKRTGSVALSQLNKLRRSRALGKTESRFATSRTDRRVSQNHLIPLENDTPQRSGLDPLGRARRRRGPPIKARGRCGLMRGLLFRGGGRALKNSEAKPEVSARQEILKPPDL